jgi:hypothetical protein
MDVHPSTGWRWRNRKSIPRTQLRRFKKRPCGRRYKFEQEQWWQPGLQLVAALIEESRRSQRVDYVIVKQESNARMSRPETQKILGELEDMLADGMPADLIMTACCAALRLGPRIRRYRRKGEHNLREASIVAELKRLYPNHLTDEEARDALRQNSDYRWLRVATSRERVSQNERASTVCVSKIFPNIGRKMASYHRCKDRQRFNEVVEELRRLAGIA